jgi:hypothetical protein
MSAMHKLVALMLLVLVSGTATACSSSLPGLDDLTRDADRIYIATLLEAKYIPGQFQERLAEVEGKFKITRRLKGKVSQQFITLMSSVGGSCSIPMIVQSRYVVFQNSKGDSPSLGKGSALIESFQQDDVSEKIISSMKRTARKKRRD